MTDVPPLVQAFYRDKAVQVHVFEAHAGEISARPVTLAYRHQGRDIRDSALFAKRLQQIEETARVIGSAGYRFEIAEVNRRAGAPSTVHVSTYRSSVRGNPGNVAELAYEDDGRHVVYVSSLGQGGTSSLTRAERRRFSRTGSLLRDESGSANPLPIVPALAAALRGEGFAIDSVRSDSSGRVLTSALAACLPADTVISIFQNAMPNVGRLSRLAVVARLLVEDSWAAHSLLSSSPDGDRIDGQLTDAVRRHQPGLFDTRRSGRRSTAAATAVANLRGLAMPSIDVARGAAFRDLELAVAQQSRTICGLVFGAADPLFHSVGIAAVQEALIQLSQMAPVIVRCTIVEGAVHNAHAYYPHFYRELEAALTRPN